MGKGKAKVVVEEGGKDMRKTQNVEESIWERKKENVRVAKKEKKKMMVEGEGEGGVEEWGGEGEEGVGGSRSRSHFREKVDILVINQFDARKNF